MGSPNDPQSNVTAASPPPAVPPDTTPERAPSPEVTAAQISRKAGFFELLGSHPKGFWFIFWGEFAERCCYYGMRAILATYMAEQLGLGQASAGTYMSFFIAACYFLPLVGGYLADNYFGKYWTIVGFSVPYTVGLLILGIETPLFLFIALSLLAMGSGVIKPNISTLMGMTYDQQRPGQEQLRSTAFSMFYMAINIGAGISQFAMPLIRNEYGYAVAFLFPAALMVVAFIIFALGKPFYAREVISRTPSTPEERALKFDVLKRIAGLFILVMFFWAIFDQSASTWIFFADIYMDANLGPLTVDAEQIQALNAVLIVLLLPFITALWVYLDRRGLKVRATDKMIIGFLLTAACMAVMALAALLTGPTVHSSRLALKDGVVTLSQGRVSFPEGVVEVRNTQAKVERGRVTLEGGEVLSGSGALPMARAGEVFPAHRVKVEGNRVEIKHGRVFVTDGTVRVQSVEKGKAPGAEDIGVATVQGGKPTAATGNLELKQEAGTVTGPGKAAVLGPGEYTVSESKVSLWWQALAYLLLTVAEILISVTGLELAFVAAPKSMKSFVTALWLVTVGMANLFINAPVTNVYPLLPPALYFGVLTATLLVVTVLFLFVARRFNERMAQAEAQARLAAAGPAPTGAFGNGEPPNENIQGERKP